MAEKNLCIKNTPLLLLTKVTFPTLIMAGELGSHTPEAAYEMAQHIPEEWGTYELFENAGSPVYKDEPETAKLVIETHLRAIC